jgi:hypothetical protein
MFEPSLKPLLSSTPEIKKSKGKGKNANPHKPSLGFLPLIYHLLE